MTTVTDTNAGAELAELKAKVELVEQHLGRPPTADEIDQLARGVKLSGIKSAAAAN